MPNEKTDESNKDGAEVDTPVTPSQKLKEENDAMEKELTRKEELRSRDILGGKSDAGGSMEKTKEEKLQAETAAFLSDDED